jgi:hypothetical protein
MPLKELYPQHWEQLKQHRFLTPELMIMEFQKELLLKAYEKEEASAEEDE